MTDYNGNKYYIYSNITSCLGSSGFNLQGLLSDFSYAISTMQSGYSYANINTLDNGVGLLGSAFDKLCGLASVCLPYASSKINYVGECGKELMALREDFSLDHGGT